MSFPSELMEGKDGEIAQHVLGSWSENTNQKYAERFRDFVRWCGEEGCGYLPASETTAARYIVHLIENGASVSALKQVTASIARAHKLCRHPNPMAAYEIQLILKAHRREAKEPPTRARPITLHEIRLMVRAIEDKSAMGLRDRAMLLVGFAGGFRMGELLGIQVGHLDWQPEGVVVRIPKSKGDREGRGQEATLPRVEDTEICPVTALRDVLRERRYRLRVDDLDPDAYVFTSAGKGRPPYPMTERRLSKDAWAERLRQMAERASVSTERLTTHSLRAGMATEALEAGADLASVARLGRWSSLGMVLTYDRRARWRNNAAAHVLAATGQVA